MAQFKISKKVALPINDQPIKNKDFIPKEVPFLDNKEAMEAVAIGLNERMPVLLIGETGTGKTSMVRHLCAGTNNGFVRVNHNGGTTVEDIVGRWLITDKGTEWVDGILIEAMKNGYTYLADEINAASAEINFVYHSVTDDDGRVVLVEKGNEVVIPHPNFRFIGAMNPATEYAGTKELNKALLSRFLVVKMDFVPPKIEKEIVTSRTKVSDDVAERMVKFATEIRGLHAKQQIRFVLSTRELLMWAALYEKYDKYMVSAEFAVLNKVSEEDFSAVNDLLALHFKTIDKGVATPKSVVKPDGSPFEVGDKVQVNNPSEPFYGMTGTVAMLVSTGNLVGNYDIGVKLDIPFPTGDSHDLGGALDEQKGRWYRFGDLKHI